MDDTGRDDFDQKTREIIAKSAGYICSYPGCERLTVAKSGDRKSGVTVTGVAAHIAAAAKGGPRYDPKMSSDERASCSNGIWLCQTHAKFIDDNKSVITVDKLKAWKREHENIIFKKVEHGKHAFVDGVVSLKFNNIGVFSGEYDIFVGRHNLIFGNNGSGKTTLCDMMNSISGSGSWKAFDEKFGFSKGYESRSYLEIVDYNGFNRRSIRISPQLVNNHKNNLNKKGLQRLDFEVDGRQSICCGSKNKFIYLGDQLYRRARGIKSPFAKGVRFLSEAFNINESFVWDSLNVNLFTSSTFGYKFKRTGKRKVSALVPDGRVFYLPIEALSASEQVFAFLDVLLALVDSYCLDDNVVIMFDSDFYSMMCDNNVDFIVQKLMQKKNIQTIFCFVMESSCNYIKSLNIDKWINSQSVGDLHIHSFL